MTVKTHLKQICDLEQTAKETELKIPKHKGKKEEVERNIAKKREELESDITSQNEKISNLASCIKRRTIFKFAGIQKEKNITITVSIITVIVQAIITAIMVALFGVNNYISISIAYTVIYAIFAASWLHMAYYEWFKFPYFKTLCALVILAILYQATYWYFKSCDSIGINIIGANVIFTAFIVGVEIYVGLRACKKAIISQKKEYAKNQKWLQESEIQLNELKRELEAMQQNLAKFNSSAKSTLLKMNADITALENFYATTKKQLKELYSQNVLHKNYQNWVAAATIYEYLDVGRCYELKGPDGAYNLYEKELIAKKILDSLSAINSSINHYGSSISTSQMYIRNQLSECNRNVESIVINTYGF